MSLALSGAALLLCPSAMAKTHATSKPHGGHGGNCVAYAREVTGVQIAGNAGMWWNHAEGRYQRGHKPAPGSILVFKPYGRMHLGHVAVVSRIVGSREILVDHANWVRGRITTAMSVIDVSPANDWTVVKVSGMHGRDNPTFGFIYPREVEHAADLLVAATAASAPARHAHEARARLAAAEPPHKIQHDVQHARARLALAVLSLEAADRPRHHARSAHEASARAKVKPADLVLSRPPPHPPAALAADRRRERPKREEAAAFY